METKLTCEPEIRVTVNLTGDKGDPGYTPVKGVDYWTPEDVAEIDTAISNAEQATKDAKDTTEDAENRVAKLEQDVSKAESVREANEQSRVNAEGERESTFKATLEKYETEYQEVYNATLETNTEAQKGEAERVQAEKQRETNAANALSKFEADGESLINTVNADTAEAIARTEQATRDAIQATNDSKTQYEEVAEAESLRVEAEETRENNEQSRIDTFNESMSNWESRVQGLSEFFYVDDDGDLCQKESE